MIGLLHNTVYLTVKMPLEKLPKSPETSIETLLLINFQQKDQHVSKKGDLSL